MTSNLRIQSFTVVFGITLFFGAGSAQAQRAAMAIAPHVTAVHLRSTAARTATAARPLNRNAAAVSTRARSRTSANVLFGSGSFAPFNPIGSMGFGPSSSFFGSGLNNQDWAIKAAIDPATQWRLFETQKFLGSAAFSASGFYLVDGGYYEAPSDTGETDQTQEQPEAQQANVDQGQRPGRSAEASAPSEQQAASESLPEDVGQFVIVLRNGTEIQAVAFSRSGDRIIYITTDGLRRSLALADVDTQSTVRINDERGTPIQLPL